jgi:transposase
VLVGYLAQWVDRAGIVVQANPLLTQKKRLEDEFIARQQALTLSRKAATEGVIRLIYFDEASFCASPPVQRSWSPRSQPHATEPAKHCTRSVLGALDFGTQQLHTKVHTGTINRERVIDFLDGIITQGDDRPTLIILDNARIHHNIPEDILDRWFIDHRAFLIHLPPYSPELNLIEIVWKKLKYHWRRFVTWSKESFDNELHALLSGYGSKFQISFS